LLFGGGGIRGFFLHVKKYLHLFCVKIPRQPPDNP
jgi:hypothetical protein